jgi:hypothetical protein
MIQEGMEEGAEDLTKKSMTDNDNNRSMKIIMLLSNHNNHQNKQHQGLNKNLGSVL